MVSLISFTLTFFSFPIMIQFGIPNELAHHSSTFVKWNIFERVTDCFMYLLRGIIISLDKQNLFMPIGFFSLSVFMIFSSFFRIYLGWTFMSYTVARILKTYSELVLVLYFIKKYAPKEIFFIPEIKDCFKNFKKILKNSIFTIIGTYGECLSNEMTTFFVASYGSITDTGSWVIF